MALDYYMNYYMDACSSAGSTSHDPLKALQNMTVHQSLIQAVVIDTSARDRYVTDSACPKYGGTTGPRGRDAQFARCRECYFGISLLSLALSRRSKPTSLQAPNSGCRPLPGNRTDTASGCSLSSESKSGSAGWPGELKLSLVRCARSVG
jgi:hypothetical protein